MQFMSCSTLLADLRAAQKATADLEDQLEAAQVAAARQKQRCEQDVSNQAALCSSLSLQSTAHQAVLLCCAEPQHLTMQHAALKCCVTREHQH